MVPQHFEWNRKPGLILKSCSHAVGDRFLSCEDLPTLWECVSRKEFTLPRGRGSIFKKEMTVPRGAGVFFIVKLRSSRVKG